MTKAQIRAAILRIQSEQNAIALECGFTELLTYTAKYYGNKPREPAQTGTIRNDSENSDFAYRIGKRISQIIRRLSK